MAATQRIPKLLIFDGMDNTGKSTTIKQFTELLDAVGYTYLIIKADNPIKPGTDINGPRKKTIETLTTAYYDRFVNKILENAFRYSIIILDRSWISEYVYGQIYRDRSEMNCIKQIYQIEDKIRKVFHDQTYLILNITTNSNALKYWEDGKSLSKNSENMFINEYNMFSTIHSYTTIEHKLIYDPFQSSSKDFKKPIPLIISIYNKIFLNKDKQI